MVLCYLPSFLLCFLRARALRLFFLALFLNGKFLHAILPILDISISLMRVISLFEAKPFFGDDSKLQVIS
jgi:hypothetical protein